MIRSIQRWRGVAGTYSIEVELAPDLPVYRATGDESAVMVRDSDFQRLPDGLVKLIDEPDDCPELVIEFESSGYYDPGCMYQRNGDPGDPPEGDDERTVTAITLGRKPVPKELWAILEELYRAEIDATEIDHDDGPDPDDERDRREDR